MTDEEYFREAGEEAKRSLCLEARCGSIIVLDDAIIGRGYNAPPQDRIEERMCNSTYPEEQRKPKADRSCCVHAEWRAITNALKSGTPLTGATLYFTRVNEEGELLRSGEPYCTVCSRLALDTGINYFALWHEDGIKKYDTKEYNDLSYKFHQA